MKSIHRNRKRVCALERCRYEIPSKRRKLCHYSSVVAYDQKANSKSISNSPDKGIERDTIGAGASASVKNYRKNDHHGKNLETFFICGFDTLFDVFNMDLVYFSVKFSIKSFKVPELFIEVPENETVGSLKVRILFMSMMKIT